MTTIANQIESLIEKFNSLTNGCCKPRVYENSAWQFLNFGFTQDDLELVVKYIQRENSRNDYQHSLDLRKLLNDAERFNDFLSRAFAQKSRQRTPAQQAVHEFRRFTPEDVRDVSVKVGDVLNQIQAQ